MTINFSNKYDCIGCSVLISKCICKEMMTLGNISAWSLPRHRVDTGKMIFTRIFLLKDNNHCLCCLRYGVCWELYYIFRFSYIQSAGYENTALYIISLVHLRHSFSISPIIFVFQKLAISSNLKEQLWVHMHRAGAWQSFTLFGVRD